MKNKLTLLTVLLLLFGSASFSQTVKLDSVSAYPGESVIVPLSVTGFTGIGSITFHIRYKPSVLTYTNFTSTYSGFTVGATDSTIHIVYVAPVPPGSFNFSDGILLNLHFNYAGMTNSPLRFLGSCEVTRGFTPIYPAYTNGAVLLNTEPIHKATMMNSTADPAGNVAVPLNYEDFDANVGSITQEIHFDAAKLAFVSLEPIGNLVGATANAVGDVVTIVWTDIDGKDINFPDNGFILHFGYTQSRTETTLEFYPGCSITTNTGEILPVTYQNAIVNPGEATSFAEIGSFAGVQQGQSYDVPLLFSDFPSGTNGTGAVTVSIQYDPTKVIFLGETDNIHGAMVNNIGSKVMIVWSDISAPDINGDFLKLKFQYIGITPADFTFGNECVFSLISGAPIVVGYTDGKMVPGENNAKAIIGKRDSQAGAEVFLPVYFSGLPAMGAATMYINYDYDKLTYLDVPDTCNPYHAMVAIDPVTHKLSVVWSGLNTDINGTFLKFRFFVNIGGFAPVTFAEGCELANGIGQIIPTTWINGGVNCPPFVPGAIEASEVVCYEGTFAPMTGVAPTGGTLPYSYQWQSSVDDVEFSDIPGAVELNYAPEGTYTSTVFYRLNQYSAHFEDPMVTTNEVEKEVAGDFMPGTVSGDQTICYYTAPELPLTSEGITGGIEPYSYQWYSSTDGLEWMPIEGATEDTYQPDTLVETTYFKQLQTSFGGCGSEFSTNMAVITVNPLPTANISGTNSICYGFGAQLTVDLTGTAPWDFTIFDGVTSYEIVGITENPYPFIVYPDGTTTYTITVVSDANTCSNIGTGEAVITVNPLPTGILSGTSTICADAVPVDLTVALTGTAPWSITYSDGSVSTTIEDIAESPFTFEVAPAVTTTYTLLSVSDALCTAVGSGEAVVTVNPLPTAAISGTTSVCYGFGAQLSIYFTGTAPWDFTVYDGVNYYPVVGNIENPYTFIVYPDATLTY
ncbi:MAG: cohesin domain-containing protein, partial [Bacteroidales bacterium]|nr:cohesin domain-containing protein [Bacteroidales bacterium]